MEFRDEVAPRASLIVVGLREAPMLVACLDSIAESVAEVTYEVIVVLNDPTPELSAEIEQHVHGATVFSFRANLGFGVAVNFAAERARGDYLVLLNDDCEVTRGWLESLVETEERRDRCAAVGSTFLHPDGTQQEAGAVLWSDGSTSTVGDGVEAGYMQFERRCDYCSAGSLLIRKDVWDQLGGFDESYYPAYFEDVDFCLRAAEAGWDVWYQPLAVVRHSRSTSTEANLRRHLWQRSHDTFVSRWSRLLETREPNGALERAVWKAMGGQTRVLVIGDELPDPGPASACGRMYEVVSALAREPDIYVTFFRTVPHDPLPNCFPLCSVRVINDLEEHLATDGVDFDLVVVAHPHNGDTIRELVARCLARAPRLRRRVASTAALVTS